MPLQHGPGALPANRFTGAIGIRTIAPSNNHRPRVIGATYEFCLEKHRPLKDSFIAKLMIMIILIRLLITISNNLSDDDSDR